MINIEKQEWVGEFLAYMEKFDPLFRSKICGANEMDIQEIEKNLGVSLPQDYREYMENMGQNDGGLFENSRAKTNVTELLEIIKIIREERPDVDFKNFIPIASCDNVEGWALTKKDNQWQVVTINNNLPGDYVARSLPDLVFYTGFSKQVSLAPHQVRFKIGNKNIKLSDIEAQASSMGFITEPFCDNLSYFGIKNDILLMVHTSLTIGFEGFVASSDLNSAQKEANQLVEVLGGIISAVR